MKRLLFSLAVFILILPAMSLGSENDTIEETLFKANQAYKAGRYQEAVDGYSKLIDEGHENGQIYYNLGSACLKANDIGRAVLYYQRARLYMPRDADLNFNLRYAMDQTRDSVPKDDNLIFDTFFWLDEFNLQTFFYVFVIFNILFWGILIVRLFNRAEWTFYTLITIFSLTLLVSASFGLKYYQMLSDRRIVVLSEEINILAGPDAGDTVLFKLHAGAIVNYDREEDGWFLVKVSDEKRGWSPATDLAKIIVR